MRVDCGDEARTHRLRAAGIDRDPGPASQLQDRARIALGHGQRQIAGDRDEAQYIDFGCGQCQQDRHRVVGAGVGIDDDWARHRFGRDGVPD